MAKLAAQVISNQVNGLFMQKVIRAKGWTKQDATYAVVDFLTCGKKVSISDFMATYEVKPVSIQ